MNRRHALASAAALFGVPAPARASAVSPLPDASLAASDPEKYWARIRDEQFYLPDWRAFMNNGSLGVAPRPVLKAVTDFLENSAALTLPGDEYPRWGYETLDAHRREVADYIGCQKDQLAFTHNATEALSTIAAGIDLKEGDEVLMTDQEHPSGKAGWQVRQARHGIRIREVPIALPPKNSGEVADRMVSAIGGKTRVLFFSAITTTTGLVMPTREICDAARAKGVITVVDGAHLNGQLPLRVEDLGCDYYAGSPHKWMFAPAGCGVLWGREEMLDRLWPTNVTGNWDNRKLKAARFMFVGTNNRAIFEGLVAGVRFSRAIGPERSFARIHQLAGQVREEAAKLDSVELLTPQDGRMYGSLVTFRLKEPDAAKFFRLCRERKIWVSGAKNLRVSTHIHTRPRDIAALFQTLRDARG